jgi:hypothetical protein
MSRKADAPLRDPGAMSGLLTGLSFIAGVGGGVALADSPYPRPGSEPSEVSRYFTENSRSARLSAAGQLISTAGMCPGNEESAGLPYARARPVRARSGSGARLPRVGSRCGSL